MLDPAQAEFYWYKVYRRFHSSVNCLHAESLCIEGDVRIVSTSSFGVTGAGRVEVCHNSVWGTIAQPGSLWSEKNAQVACRQAGYAGALNSVFTIG